MIHFRVALPPGLAAGLPPGLAAGLPPGLAAGLPPGLAAVPPGSAADGRDLSTSFSKGNVKGARRGELGVGRFVKLNPPASFRFIQRGGILTSPPES